VKYKIVRGRPWEVVERTTTSLACGWKLHGPPFATGARIDVSDTTYDPELAQCLVKPDQQEAPDGNDAE